MVTQPEFWRGKRVLVTGHTGFKGSWLCVWLLARGARVSGYALEPATQPSMFERARLDEEMTSVIADVRDGDRLAKVVAAERPEIVLHLAAQPLVRESYGDPVGTYATNVMGTVNLLEACRRTEGIRAIVVVTSDKCYENHEWVWGYRESDPMGGFDPYSSSKGCAELVTAAYGRSFFHRGTQGGATTRAATARAGNVIGGGDWALDRLIPDMVRAFEARRSVTIRNPRAVRPWQHVLEPLHGYLTLAERLFDDTEARFDSAWNFGPAEADSRPVEWLADAVCERWGDSARWQLDSGAHPHEARQLRLDCSKARTALEWTPRLSLETALDWTVEWYRAALAGEDVREITAAQIARYEALA